ncbi:hypothetical protein [Streptomyces pratensis]|uniref:hypothetical protein n=1 Tax=Streptomyces pratensis TaxID=1169025 RepID=UPI0036327025
MKQGYNCSRLNATVNPVLIGWTEQLTQFRSRTNEEMRAVADDVLDSLPPL